MIIAVASGKGGTGKTTVAVNLALVAASRLGARAAYCGVLGDDDLSRFTIQELEREGGQVDARQPAAGFRLRAPAPRGVAVFPPAFTPAFSGAPAAHRTPPARPSRARAACP